MEIHNHTATHMLHEALRHKSSATMCIKKGSNITSERLRSFDLHDNKMTDEEKKVKTLSE